MRTISKNITHEIAVEKSKFICYLRRVTSLEDANEQLSTIKKTHYDASHHVYALIINNTLRSTDDGEPSGTAGMPILNVLINNELNETLAVVVRYYGGTKLGTGGLARAYTRSVVETLELATTLKIQEMDEIKITVDYPIGNLLLHKIDAYLENKYYGEQVELYYLIDPEETETFIESVRDITQNRFTHEILGTKLFETEDI